MTADLILTVIGSALLILGAVIILGLVVVDFTWLNLLKGSVAIVAQLLTSAVGSFALARAGYLTGSRPVATTEPDELARDSGLLEPGSTQTHTNKDPDVPTHEM